MHQRQRGPKREEGVAVVTRARVQPRHSDLKSSLNHNVCFLQMSNTSRERVNLAGDTPWRNLILHWCSLHTKNGAPFEHSKMGRESRSRLLQPVVDKHNIILFVSNQLTYLDTRSYGSGTPPRCESRELRAYVVGGTKPFLHLIA